MKKLEFFWKGFGDPICEDRPVRNDYVVETVEAKNPDYINKASLKKDGGLITINVEHEDSNQTYVVKAEAIYGIYFRFEKNYFNLNCVGSTFQGNCFIGDSISKIWFGSREPNQENNRFYFDELNKALKDFIFGD